MECTVYYFMIIVYVVAILVPCELVFARHTPDDKRGGSFWKDANDFRSAYCCQCPNDLQFPFWKMEKSLRIPVIKDDELATDAVQIIVISLLKGLLLGIFVAFVIAPILLITVTRTLKVRIKNRMKITRSKAEESNGEMDKDDISGDTFKQHKIFPETTREIAVSNKSKDEPAANVEERTTPLPCDDWCSNHPKDDLSKTTENEENNPEDAREIGEEADHLSCEWPIAIKHSACLDTGIVLYTCEGGIPILKDKQLLQKYGVLESEGRYKMLLLCAKKARQQENRSYGMDLKKALEKFLHKKIKTGGMSYKEFCRLVVQLVPEDKWTRFVRLHLNLEEEEIQTFRRKYCTFNSEQKLQIQQGICWM